MSADDEMTSGEISRSFERVEAAIKDLASETKQGFVEVNTRFDLMRGEFVHRTEWALYREATDTAIKEVKADLLDDVRSIKADATSKRVPWTAVVGVITGLVAILIPLIR